MNNNEEQKEPESVWLNTEENIRLDEVKIVSTGPAGAKTQLFINGKRVCNAKEISFSSKAGGLNEFTVTFLPKNVTIEGENVIGQFQPYVKKETNNE